MEEFDELWNEDEIEADPSQGDLDQKTPDYLIRDAKAKYHLLMSMALVYLHARHGESMGKLCSVQEEKEEIEFDL